MNMTPISMRTHPQAVRFGSIKLVIQSDTFAPLDQAERKEQLERARLIQEDQNRPPGQTVRNPEALQAAVELAVGKPLPRAWFFEEATRKFQTFVKQQQAEHPKHFPMMLMHLGRKDHPRDGARTVAMKLLIDGEDVARVMALVWQKAFFPQPPAQNTAPANNNAPQNAVDPEKPEPHLYLSNDYSPGYGLQKAFQSWMDATVQELIAQYQDGYRANIIDLDA